MTVPQKHQKYLRLFAAFAFTWPMQNKMCSIILTIFGVFIWISGYIIISLFNFFMWTSSLVTAITQINIYVFVITGLTLWITGYKYNNRLALIFQQFAKVDRELQMKNLNQNNFHITTTVIWAILMLSSILSLYANGRAHGINSGLDHIFFGGQFICLFASHSLFTVYINIVEAVRLRYQFMVEQVIKLKCEFNAVKRKRQLICLQSAHLDVSHIVQTTNTTFGISILAIITMEFMQLLSALYMFAFGSKCIDIEMIFEKSTYLQCLFLLPSVIIIGYIAYICEITINTVVKYGKCL